MSNRVVAVFTGNRAEYGLQYPILRAISAHPDLEYRLIVSGAHLDKDFGRTLSEIQNDGFAVHAEVKIEMVEDTLYATAQAIGTGVSLIGKALAELRPDVLVVYADRYEAFAAVIAGTQMNIPTAHLEGGDLTRGGALDDSVRHAMTKLAHLHFTTNQQSSNRVMGMGEEPWRVHTVGFPAIDLVQQGIFTGREEILARYHLDPARPIILFTQHSVTTQFDEAQNQIRPVLAGLRELAREGAQVILTYPNNDAGGRHIIAELEAFVRDGPANVQLHQSLGRANYHGVLALARDPSIHIVCAGNSSSGVKETPAFGCPDVNIGSRQDGRLRAENVLDAPYEAEAVIAAIKKGLFDEEFRRICRTVHNPYGVGDAGKKIADVLATVPLDERLIRKRMTLAGEAKEGWFR